MPRYHAVLVTLILFLLTACSSGNNTTPVPVAPVFSSTPGTQAVEGSAYTYQLAASGTAVTFSLTNAPIGATLSGNMISWTPTAQQSRISNSFTITATASGGASATQSWAVTPSGTIRISRIDTWWNESGSTNMPFDWSRIASYAAALVPQSDGSFKSFSGAADANGVFEIPNVPAGYYWLKLGPGDTYWTSSSTFDLGRDVFVPIANTTVPVTSTTHLNFSFTSLDAAAGSGQLQLDSPELAALSYTSSTNAGSTTFVGGLVINGILDLSVIKNAFVRQYEPTLHLILVMIRTGPPEPIHCRIWSDDRRNQYNHWSTESHSSGIDKPQRPGFRMGAPVRSAQAKRLPPCWEVAQPFRSDQTYIAADGPNISGSNPIDLIWTKPGNTLVPGPTLTPVLTPVTCSANPPLTTDVGPETVPYSDPLSPAGWRSLPRVCQNHCWWLSRSPERAKPRTSI